MTIYLYQNDQKLGPVSDLQRHPGQKHVTRVPVIGGTLQVAGNKDPDQYTFSVTGIVSIYPGTKHALGDQNGPSVNILIHHAETRNGVTLVIAFGPS